ncbi:MAG: tryptophan--tRNA ligase, partial [Acidimicrobiales bacterium]
MARVFSGVQPSGDLHLGNYLGAFRNWVADQDRFEAFYCVVDLHALSQEHDPAQLASKTLDAATNLLATGLDPHKCVIFAQSHVPQHPRLLWLLECTATFGELRRMTQFKEKGGENESVRAGLFTYPVLQAADILLYDADRVPVGEDQRQHIELTRDIALRFNRLYGETFVVPELTLPPVAARVMDLQEPTRKMSKSVNSPLGTVGVADGPEEVDRKVRRAVTDTESEVRYDPQVKPGVSNLLEILAAATGSGIDDLAASYSSYSDLKRGVSEAVVELLRPVRERRAELLEDRSYVESVLA